MYLSSKNKLFLFLFSISAWLAVIFNFLVINRYAYKATELINYSGGFVAIVIFFLITANEIKSISALNSKKFSAFVLLFLMPPGMAAVGFVTVYAIGGTLTQVINIANESKGFLITITSKNINDYVPAGGCRYTIDLNMYNNGTKINNYCVNEQAFDYLKINSKYTAQGATSIFGIIIYEIDNKAIKTIPRLGRY